MVWYDMVRYIMVYVLWYGMVWYGEACVVLARVTSLYCGPGRQVSEVGHTVKQPATLHKGLQL